jgi:hypothetical protein
MKTVPLDMIHEKKIEQVVTHQTFHFLGRRTGMGSPWQIKTSTNAFTLVDFPP